MNQPLDQTQMIQTLYELSMAIGTSLELHQMLKESLRTFLKKLNCVAGGIYQRQVNADGRVEFKKAYTIPRHTARNATYQVALAQIPSVLDKDKAAQFLSSLPLVGQSEADHYYHLLELPDFGLMILVRNNKVIDPVMIKSLKPLQEKLAFAANACLAEDALREAQARSETILASVTVPLLISGLSDGKIIYANQLLADTIRLPLDDLIGDVTPDFYYDSADRQRLLDLLREQGSLNDYELQLKRSDGELFWAWISIRFFDYQGERALITSLVDITDRRRAEEQLVRLGTVIEKSLDGTAIADLDGTVQFVNPAWAKMHGYTVEELIGQPFAVFYTEEQLHNEALPFQRKAKETGSNQGEIGHKRKDGSTFLTWMSVILLKNDAGVPVNLVASAQDITKRKQAETTIAKRAAELRTVAEMSMAVATTLNTQQLMQDVVDLTKERFNLYHAHIYLLNPQDKTLVLTSGAGDIGQRMVEEDRRILLSKKQSLVAQAARSKQGVIENDVLNNPAFLPHPLLPDTRAEMAVPMLVGNRVVGVLDVQSNKVGHFTQQDINVQSTLAAQVGIALDNARSFESTQRALSETETLLNIMRETTGSFDLKNTLTTVLDEILEAIGFDAGLFTVINQETNSLEMLAERLPASLLEGIRANGFDNSLCDMVFRSGERLIIQDMGKKSELDLSGLISLGFASYIGIPLVARGEVLGTLCLFSKTYLATKNTNENLLKAIGQQVGTAVQTMTLFEQATLQSQRLTKLNEMGNALNGATSMGEIYQIVSQHTLAVLESDRASLALVNDDQKTVSILGLSGIEGAIPLGIELPIEGTALGCAILKQRLVSLPQDDPLEKFPDSHKLQDDGIKTTICAPLNVHGQIVGTLNLASEKLYKYGESEQAVLQQITNLVSSAMESLKFLQDSQLQSQRLTKLNEMGNALNGATSTDEIYQIVSHHTLAILESDRASLALVNDDQKTVSILGLSGIEGAIPLGIELPIEGTALGYAILKQRLVSLPQDGPLEKFPDSHRLQDDGIKTTVCAPLNVHGQIVGTLNLASEKLYKYGESEQAILQQITSLVSSAMETRAFVDQIEKQAEELKTVAEVSTSIATTLNTQQLMQEVVDLTKSKFGYYHTHVYLLNDARDTLRLTAGAGEVGQQMVAEGRAIPLDQEQSLVAQVARTAQGITENDVLANPAFLPHPLLPETRSEMAVPMIVGDRVIGVLDVQANERNRFTEQDVAIQTTLATQVAVALENAYSFEEAQKAVANLNELTRRLTREGWQDYLNDLPAEEARFIYDPSQTNTALAANGFDTETTRTLAYEIMIHGEAIGQLAVIPSEAEDQVDSEMAEIITAVTEQLSARIENLRLTEQTQTALADSEEHARRLAQLNEMSAALNQAETISDIYKITVVEARRILSVDRVSLPLLNDMGDRFEVVAFSGKESKMPIGMEIPVKVAPMTKAIQKNRVIKGEANYEIKSALFAPILAGDRAIGTINIGNKRANTFDSNDENLLQQIASLVGSSIENMNLLKNEQARAQREQVLREITERVRGSVDVETIMKTAVSEIGRALGRPVIVSLDKQYTGEG